MTPPDAPWTDEDQRRYDELLQAQVHHLERTTAAEAYELTCLCSRRRRLQSWERFNAWRGGS